MTLNHDYPEAQLLRAGGDPLGSEELHWVQQSYMLLHCFRMQSGLCNTPHPPSLILHFALDS